MAAWKKTYIDKIDGLVDQGNLAGDVGDHITLKTWDRDRELLVSNELLDLLEKLGKRLDLGRLLGVGDALIVLAIATRILPVDIYRSQLAWTITTHGDDNIPTQS